MIDEKYLTDAFLAGMEWERSKNKLPIREAIAVCASRIKEKAVQQSVNADVMPCGHPLAESYQGEDGGTYCRICESA